MLISYASSVNISVLVLIWDFLSGRTNSNLIVPKYTVNQMVHFFSQLWNVFKFFIHKNNENK